MNSRLYYGAAVFAALISKVFHVAITARRHAKYVQSRKGAVALPYNTRGNTHPGTDFRDASSKQGGARKTKMVGLEKSGRYASMDASLGVCALPVVQKIGLKKSFEGVLSRVSYGMSL